MDTDLRHRPARVSRRATLPASALAVAVLAGCAANTTPGPKAAAPPGPLEGFWRLADQTTVVHVAPCELGRPPLCGRLLVFEGDQQARDYLSPGFFAWGQRLCGSDMLSRIEPASETGVYEGAYYAPDEGQHYNLMLTRKDAASLEARIYLGASVDEAVDMAVGTALGSAPSALAGLSFVTRASVGKELLGETQVWHRVDEPSDRCDRPVIRQVEAQPEAPGEPPSDPAGHWLTQDGSILVEITPCAPHPSARCGFIRALPGDDPALVAHAGDLCGLPVLTNLTFNATKRRWDAGELFDPESEQIHDAIVRVDGERLVVRAYEGWEWMGTDLHWQPAAPTQVGCEAPALVEVE